MNSDQRIAALLPLVPFTALGLARFAFGLVLPSMQADLGWSYVAAGVVTTANALGYLAGAIAAPQLVARNFTDRGLIVGGVIGTAISLAATGISDAYELILVARFGAGLFGGIAFVAAGTLAARLSKAGAPSALVWFPAGAGAAIVVGALGFEPLSQGDDSRWPVSWVVLGAIALAAAALLARAVPKGARPATTAPAGDGRPELRLRSLEASYGLFGLGYIGYVTFVGAYLRATGSDAIEITYFWTLLGLAAMTATIAWPRILSRVGSRSAYFWALACCTAGVLVSALTTSAVGAALSAVLFGGSFLAVVSTVTSAARDASPPHLWPSAIARLTVAFGVGQILGPVAAGLLGDSSSGLQAGLLLSSATLAVGSAVAFVYARALNSNQNPNHLYG